MTTRRGVIGMVAGAIAGGREIAEEAASFTDMAAKKLASVGSAAALGGPIEKGAYDEQYRIAEMAKLRRWASGDFTEDEIRESHWCTRGPNIMHDADRDLTVMKSMSPNAKLAIIHSRWKERQRQDFMANAARQLAGMWGIKL